MKEKENEWTKDGWIDEGLDRMDGLICGFDYFYKYIYIYIYINIMYILILQFQKWLKFNIFVFFFVYPGRSKAAR